MHRGSCVGPFHIRTFLDSGLGLLSAAVTTFRRNDGCLSSPRQTQGSSLGLGIKSIAYFGGLKLRMVSTISTSTRRFLARASGVFAVTKGLLFP